MGQPSDKLKKWVMRLIADITEEGTLHRFELFHTIEGEPAERLGIYRVKSDDGGEENATDLVQTLWDDAEHDAETRKSGDQRYVVVGFRHEEQQDPEAQFPFRLTRSSRFAGDSSDPPTEKGERAMMMRQLNENHTIMAGMVAALSSRISTELDKETARRQAAEDRLAKRNLELEDLADRRLDREVDRAARLQREKLTGDVVSSLLPLVPFVASALIERVAPGKPKDQNGHDTQKVLAPVSAEQQSREVLLKELFANLTNHEAKAVFEAVKPMKRIALGQILQGLEAAETPIQKAGIDSAMSKFLKSLEGEEIMAVLSAFDQGNRNRFMLIYQSYGKAEEAHQEELPEVLRDNAPQKSDTAESQGDS